jgi:Zn-dependent protease
MEPAIRSWKLGRAFGIDLFVHWSFLLIPLLAFSANWGQGASAAIGGVGLVLALFGCVLLHELGHALMARSYGIGTRDITLYPIGGVARLERMPEKPLAEMAIAVAGPLVNVVIAAGLWLGFNLAGRTLALDGPYFGSLTHSLLSQLFLANVMLVMFNMVPALPMDGGRVLRAGLAIFFDHAKATEIAVMISRAVAIFFVLFAIAPQEVVSLLVAFSPGIAHTVAQFHSPFLAVIGVFLFFAGAQELAFARRQKLQRAAERHFAETIHPQERFVTVDAQVPAGWSGFTWDPQAGVWIQWRDGQPIGAVSGGPPR